MLQTEQKTVVLVSGGAGCQGHGRVYVSELSRELAAQGDYRVVVVIPRSAKLRNELEAGGIRVEEVDADFEETNASRFRRFGKAAGVMRGFTRLRVNHRFLDHAAKIAIVETASGGEVVCHFLDYEYISLVRVLARLRPHSCRVALTVHPSDFRPRGFSAAAWYKRFVGRLLEYSAPDAIFCHGEWIADRLRRQLRMPSTILHHQPYPAHESIATRDRAAARQELDLPEQVKHWVLWYGMVRRNKRIEIAIDALAELPEEYGLLVLGSPAEVTHEAIAARVARRGVQHRVRLELRYAEDRELPLWFGAADLLLATHDASFSSASGPVADARSYGLPVVVSDAGELANYVRSFAVGRVAASDHPASFAAAIRRLLEDASALAACHDAVVKAADELSWRAFARRHVAMYDEMLGRAGASSPARAAEEQRAS